jgi:hypothetical protein
MGRVVLDMGSTIPFGDCVENNSGVDQPRNQTPEQNEQN